MRWNDLFEKPTLGTTINGVGLILVFFMLTFVVDLSMKVNQLRKNVVADEHRLKQRIADARHAQMLSLESDRLNRWIRGTRETIIQSHTAGFNLPPAQYTQSGEPILIVFEEEGLFSLATNREQPSELVYMLDYYIDRTDDVILESQDLWIPVMAELVDHQSFVVALQPNKKFFFTLGKFLRPGTDLPIDVSYWIQTGKKTPDSGKTILGTVGRALSTTKGKSTKYARIIEVASANQNGVWFEHDFGRFPIENRSDEKHYLEIKIICRDKADENSADVK